MLGILWLIIWATVGEALNNDGRKLEFFTHSHEDFTSNLRKFASNYHRHRRDAEEDTMTLSQAKLTLRLLQVYKYPSGSSDIDEIKGQSLPLAEGAKFCMMGVQTKVDCNSCTCVAGQMYMCTGMICPSKSETRRTCKNGQKRRIDSCNTCLCRNGFEICTKKNCQRTNRNAIVRSQNSEECKDGQQKEDNCNNCFCIDGAWICTQTECEDEKMKMVEHDPDIHECETGETKYDGCNHCYCNRGSWACTLILCTKMVNKNIEPKACIHGEQKKVDCNGCTCLRGVWSCTKKRCKKKPAQNRDTSDDTDGCIDGQQKQIDCNRCSCVNGLWACTRKSCMKKGKLLLIPKGRCRNDAVKKVNCMECNCINNRWQCSKKGCRKKKKLCKEGTSRLLDPCTRCYCQEGQEHCDNQFCVPLRDVPNQSILRRITTTDKCIDGRRKVADCNRCVCYKSEWFCTKKPCKTELLKIQLPIFPKPPCKEGALLILKCLRCKCAHNRWRCSTKDCYKKKRNERQCEDGTTRLVDPCTRCYCRHGREHCENKNCEVARNHLTPTDITLREGNCKLGETYRLDACNYCYCNRHKQRVCTKHKCPYPKGNQTAYQPPEAERVCKLGDRFRLDKCNYCYCDHDKKLVCSHNTCYRTKTSLRKPMKSKCTTGDKYKIDECNHCHCTFNQRWKCTKNICPTSYDHILLQPGKKSCVTGTQHYIACNRCICIHGIELCTQNNCWHHHPIRTYVHFTEPECEPGESIPAPDACNLCICLNSNIICTEYPCIERKLPGRSGTCTEGHKYYLEDGCNYCVCQDGLEYCTARACLSSTDESSSDVKCVEGEMTPQGDGCNMCVCNEGKRDCTNHECSNTRLRTGSSDTGEFQPYVARGKKRKKCIEGKTYVNREDDPSCPNKCICDNGELLCTNRQCGWGHGKGQFKGSSATHALTPSPKSVKRQFGACTENEDIPSGDSCTSCMCLHGQKICNRIHCPVMDVIWSSRFSDLDRHSNRARKHSRKGGKGIMEKEHVFCEPFTFYSPDNNRYCRNCFCLHNGLSLCLLNLCKYSKDIEQKSQSLDPDCTPGETRTPTKCVACTCSDERKWVCVRQALAACQERDCDAKDEFHMGFLPYCAECKCSVKEWYCSIKPERCPDHSNTTCPIGTLIQNPKQHCSVCLCGGDSPGSHNMCFTEAKCVKQVISHLKN